METTTRSALRSLRRVQLQQLSIVTYIHLMYLPKENGTFLIFLLVRTWKIYAYKDLQKENSLESENFTTQKFLRREELTVNLSSLLHTILITKIKMDAINLYINM